MQLISALCDERILPDQALELEQLVLNHDPVRAMFVRLMHMHAGLYQYASAIGGLVGSEGLLHDESSEQDPSVVMGETMVMPAMTESADDESIAEEEPEFSPHKNVVSAAPANQPLQPYQKGSIAAAVLLSVGLLLHFLWPSAPRTAQSARVPVAMEASQPIAQPAAKPIVGSPTTEPTAIVQIAPAAPRIAVATLDLTAAAVWQNNAGPPRDAKFIAGETLNLISGVVQLHLKEGGRLVVEGPAEVRFVSATEIALTRGRLVAKIPGGGLLVKCPTGSVTDLGTEFGVAVTPDGKTDVAVLEGKVSATLSSADLTQPPKPLVMTVGQAAIMSDKALTIDPEGAIPQQFIRKLQNVDVNSLDVTDLVSGGDGTSRRRGLAIDSLSGQIGKMSPVAMRTGDHQYHKSSGFPVVDGAFVPDGSKGAMTVDSAGHQFQFQSTTDFTYNYIWTGGKIPWTDDQGICTVMDDKVDYAADDHAIICTHSNNGLTLDLDAIRRLYPDRSLARFHCRFANTYVNGWYGALKVNPVAGAFVLVDGQCRYEKPHFTNQDGSFLVDLPLSKSDHFLTLACTDAGTDVDHAWILWADPTIDLSGQK
jgi:hypothetical protein